MRTLSGVGGGDFGGESGFGGPVVLGCAEDRELGAPIPSLASDSPPDGMNIAKMLHSIDSQTISYNQHRDRPGHTNIPNLHTREGSPFQTLHLPSL